MDCWIDKDPLHHWITIRDTIAQDGVDGYGGGTFRETKILFTVCIFEKKMETYAVGFANCRHFLSNSSLHFILTVFFVKLTKIHHICLFDACSLIFRGIELHFLSFYKFQETHLLPDIYLLKFKEIVHKWINLIWKVKFLSILSLYLEQNKENKRRNSPCFNQISSVCALNLMKPQKTLWFVTAVT